MRNDALDRYITGNYGEDQFADEISDELIEAAPDLLAACVEFVAYADCACGDDGPYKDSKCAVCMAVDAIAKAKGETLEPKKLRLEGAQPK